jgi:hypothetical protein
MFSVSSRFEKARSLAKLQQWRMVGGWLVLYTEERGKAEIYFRNVVSLFILILVVLTIMPGTTKKI